MYLRGDDGRLNKKRRLVELHSLNVHNKVLENATIAWKASSRAPREKLFGELLKRKEKVPKGGVFFLRYLGENGVICNFKHKWKYCRQYFPGIFPKCWFRGDLALRIMGRGNCVRKPQKILWWKKMQKISCFCFSGNCANLKEENLRELTHKAVVKKTWNTKIIDFPEFIEENFEKNCKNCNLLFTLFRYSKRHMLHEAYAEKTFSKDTFLNMLCFIF